MYGPDKQSGSCTDWGCQLGADDMQGQAGGVKVRGEGSGIFGG